MCNSHILMKPKIFEETKKLSISFLKPHKPVGVKTISRWIKESLKTAGVNVEHYQGHSLRSAGS